MVIHEKQKNALDLNISKIYCRLANPAGYSGNLENMPHKKILDMVLVYYVRINIADGEFLSLVVNNKLLQHWEIDDSQLDELAWCNTLRDNPIVYKPLKQVLLDMGTEPDDEQLDVYFISNEKKYLGAVCIAYPGFLERIGESFQGDFYILPSSVHECLVIPCDENIKTSQLRKTVRNMNRRELKDKDVLSDSVYRYIWGRRRLVIDNS